MDQVLFFVAGVFAIVAAAGAVWLRSPFYAVLALVVHLLSLSVLFLLLYAQFVAVVQVMVYVGAVMVLYVFVNAYVGGNREPTGGGAPSLRMLSYAIALTLAVTVGIALLGTGLQTVGTTGAKIDPSFGSPAAIGELLLTRFLLPFEGASFLLLVAAVGAVVLARRRAGAVPGERRMIAALDLLAPTGTGSMREGVGAINPVPGAHRERIVPSTGAGSPPSGRDAEGDRRPSPGADRGAAAPDDADAGRPADADPGEER